MNRFLTLLACSAMASVASAPAEENEMRELEESSKDHIREELGVNEITAPQIQKLLLDLDSFRPIPLELLADNNRDATFANRFQTALHFGILVADGFVIVIHERPQDIQDLGRALIRQSRGLGVGDSLTKRAKSLIELGDIGDWQSLRQELIRTQNDVENAMLELKDEEMAHMISLGGWIRGFQLAANATAANFTPPRAEGLVRVGVMDYFIDRLETLHPRLKRTELVILISSKLKTLRAIAAQAETRAPTESEVREMRDLSNAIIKAAMSKVDDEGRILDSPQ
jgi:hypothetical protein